MNKHKILIALTTFIGSCSTLVAQGPPPPPCPMCPPDEPLPLDGVQLYMATTLAIISGLGFLYYKNKKKISY